ncbi:MAG TPA: Gfo/Idh/MocA family oxidoreductase [Chlamydiales bacterium]|nr:Gfo/Idh/MocA family oxidoreductase [Chlamydiales bacterium]
MAIDNLHVAVIGCGLIGKRRAAQVAKDPEAKLVYAVDVNQEHILELQKSYGCQISTQWEKVISSPEIDAVIISTPNHLLAEIATAAIHHGKHLLVEKPLGRTAEESQAILSAAQQSPHFLVLKTGFNHRFHPAISKAKALVDSGEIGSLFTIRARYGHGGRPGMEKEWRSSKILCGGGELLDQGVHLIDLIQWFGGDITSLYGVVETKFWNIDVEDNGYVIAKTAQDVNAIFHVSWTNWKNIFSFEIFGTKGYINILGLGGSYGIETLEIGLRNPQGGKPSVSTIEYPGEDISWELEWKEFKQAIREKRHPLGNGEDGLKANLAIEAILKSHAEQRLIRLSEDRSKIPKEDFLTKKVVKR